MFDEYKGIPRQAIFLIVLSFIPNIAIGLIYTDLAFFLPKVQGLSEFWTGASITIMGATLVVTSIPLGRIADRRGRRKMLVLGNLCASLSLIGFALTNSLPLILVVALLEGTGEAAYAVSVGALLAEKAGDMKRTPAFSLLAFTGWICGAIGSASIFFVDKFGQFGIDAAEGHMVLYVLVGLLSLSVTPFVFKIADSAKVETTEKRGFLPKKSGKIMLRFGLYSVAIAIGAGLFVPLMTLWYSQAFGISDAVSGPVVAITNLVTALAVLLSPRIARRLGTLRAIVFTQAASMVFMVYVPLAPSFETAAVVYGVRVFMMNLSNPLTQSLIMGLVAPEERGVASGVAASMWRLPNALTTLVGASLIGAGYLALPFYIATVLYGVGISFLWVLFRDAKLPEESAPKLAKDEIVREEDPKTLP